MHLPEAVICNKVQVDQSRSNQLRSVCARKENEYFHTRFIESGINHLWTYYKININMRFTNVFKTGSDYKCSLVAAKI